MLRDTLGGLIEPMQISAGVDPLALTIQKQASDDSPSCLANPRPDRAESSLTENATSPFQAEPAHFSILPRHFLWNSRSPTASTSSTRRTSGSSQVRRDGKGQPRLHAAAVMLQRRVQKFLDPCTVDDLVKFLV